MDKKSAIAIASTVLLVTVSGVAALGTNVGVIEFPEISQDEAVAAPAKEAKQKPKAWKAPKPRVVNRVVDVPVVIPGGTIVRTLPGAAPAPAKAKAEVQQAKRLADSEPKKAAPKKSPPKKAAPKPAPAPAANEPEHSEEERKEPDAKAKAEWEREKAKQAAEELPEAEREAAKKAAEEAFEAKKESGDAGESGD
ncbi:MAG: hypothetical protein OEM67_01705 [Thermoleophilia bacterium]|nr:hypothetical protein [Thermoleophilia bacterium]